MTRFAWVATGCAVVLVFAKVAVATPTEEASLNICQAQVKIAAERYAARYSKAVGTCLQAISKQIIQNNAGDPSGAAKTCVAQFRKLNDSRGMGKSLGEKLAEAINKKCLPGSLNVTHTLADILGTGAGVPESTEVESIETWCQNFGGTGSITSVQQWIDCVAASHTCGAQQTIATQYPRAVEWLNDVAPLMSELSPPSTDTSQITDAMAGLNAVVAAMDPGNTGQASFQCGDNGQLATCTSGLATCNDSLNTCNSSNATCTSDLNTCNSNYTSCSGDLTTCSSSLATCNTNLNTVNAGTAAVGDVLSGKTFSSSNGLGLTGTMSNNGGMSFTPGTTAQTIPAGYHNGSGSVAGDTDLVAGNIVSGVSIFGVTGAALPATRLKTGQTQCDQGGGTLGACPGFPAGQDGSLQKGLARSYTDNGDGTITENKTGLIWEKLDNNANSIHDSSATFTWYNAFKKIQVLNGDATGCIAANNPDACCTGTGTGSCTPFAGQTDWRLPNVNELQSLADYGRVIPAVDPAFNTLSCLPGCTVVACSCTQSSTYWSSTTGQIFPYTAWDVYFGFGSMGYDAKSNSAYVRAVRGGS